MTQNELVITNTAITSNSVTWKGVTRTFTNATTPTTIQTNLAGPKETATNVFNAFGRYLPAGGVKIEMSSPTSMVFLATDGQLSVSGGGQPAWAYVTTNSAPTTNYYALMVPHYNMPGANTLPKKSNDADYAIGLLSFAYSNAFSEAFQGLSNHVGRTRTQDIGNKRLTNSVLDSDSRITNVAAISGTNYQIYYGRYINPSNHTPVIFSGVNYSNAFSSVGSGTDSEQFGTGAIASGLRSTALGKTASATNTDSSAFGYNSTAGGISSLALGTSAGALGTNSTAIGAGSSVSATSGNSHAYGTGVEITHKGAIVIGNSINSRETNDTLLVNETITLRGRVQVDGSQTNTTWTGTNKLLGSLAVPYYSVSTLANGNNISVNFGTNHVIRLAAGSLSAGPTICGIINGNDGLGYEVFNDTGYSVTWAMNSTSDPVPANRIKTHSGTDIVCVNQGTTWLRWEPNAQRYEVANVFPITATATNAIATSGGNGTNLTLYPSSTNNVALTLQQLANQSNDLLQAVSSAGLPMLKVNAYGSLVQSNVTANRVAVWNGDKLLTNSANVDVTELGYLDGATSAIQTQIDTKSAQGLWLPIIQQVSFSPADATIYYWGGDILTGMTTTYAQSRVEIPKTGTIKRWWFKVRIAGTLGSGETVSSYIRINDTTDVGQIDTVWNAATTDATAVTLTQAVTAGDFISIKTAAVTWATNPTQVRMWGYIYIE